MLVADGARSFVGAYVSIEPRAGVAAARFAGQREPQCTKIPFQPAFVARARSPTLTMPWSFSRCSITLPTPGILRTSSGARKSTSPPGTIQSTPLGLAWSEQTFATRREVPMPMEQFSCVSGLHRLVQRVGGAHRRSMQALGSGHVDVGFVDGDHLQLGREAVQHFVTFGGVVAIARRDVRRRRSLAGRAWLRFAAAWPNALRTCAPHKTPPIPLPARSAGRRPLPACPSATGRTALRPRRRRRPYPREK